MSTSADSDVIPGGGFMWTIGRESPGAVSLVGPGMESAANGKPRIGDRYRYIGLPAIFNSLEIATVTAEVNSRLHKVTINDHDDPVWVSDLGDTSKWEKLGASPQVPEHDFSDRYCSWKTGGRFIQLCKYCGQSSANSGECRPNPEWRLEKEADIQLLTAWWMVSDKPEPLTRGVHESSYTGLGAAVRMTGRLTR